jgi:hypothetical protein
MYCEDWIEPKLKQRLEKYKKRYPQFDIERVMLLVQTWDLKKQRWSPYMLDKDIKNINKNYHRMKSLKSLAKNDHL